MVRTTQLTWTGWTFRTSAAVGQQVESWPTLLATGRHRTSCRTAALPAGSEPERSQESVIQVQRLDTLQWQKKRDMTDLVQNSVGRLVASQTLLAQVLMGLGQTLDFSKPRVQRHSRMVGVLCQVQVSCSSQLFFDDQGLFQQLWNTERVLETD